MEARPQEAQGAEDAAGALRAAALAAAVVAGVARVGLLWDDAWAPGYDGGYYVLQVSSLRDGAPIFADRSLVFHGLALLARLVGDVVLANKLGALAFGMTAAAAVALACGRWTGRAEAALVAGLAMATAPGHLGISAEFLKNEGGLAALCLALPLLVGPPRRGPLLVAAALIGLAGLCHKLMGGLGLLVLLGALAGHRASGRPLPALGRGGSLALLGLGALSLALLRPVDLLREGASVGGRLAQLTSGRLPPVQIAEVLLVHLCPVGLLLLLRTARVRLGLGLPLLGLALVCAAPGLPFGFDLSAWRLILLGSLPLSVALGAAIPGPRSAVAASLLLLALAPGSVASQAAREPDYEAWAAVLPTIQAAVPPNGRLVAHRGLCGYLWAAGGRRCENFAPQGDPAGWWRVAYGFGEARLTLPGEAPPLPLLPGYTLVTEAAWRRFAAAEAGRYSLLTDPRNPYEARPAYVYGPQEP